MRNLIFSKGDQNIFKNLTKPVKVSEFLQNSFKSSQKSYERILKDSDPDWEDNQYDYDKMIEEQHTFISLQNPALCDKKIASFKPIKEQGEMLKSIQMLFDFKDVRHAPDPFVKDPVFANGGFRQNFQETIKRSSGGAAFDEMFRRKMEDKKREVDRKKRFEPKVEVEKSKKKRKVNPFKAVKSWYNTYLKPEKKPEKEESWFPLEEANRLRVLAGIPIVVPEIEPPVRSRWWKFRIFIFRQLSLIIWRVHPESKVKTYVIKPSIDKFRNPTPDLEFLMKH